MARGRKKELILDSDGVQFQKECMRIAMQNLPNLEKWLSALGQENPFRAILAWEKIAEFAQAKKSRDAGIPQKTEININFKARRSQKEIDPPLDEYVDITPKK